MIMMMTILLLETRVKFILSLSSAAFMEVLPCRKPAYAGNLSIHFAPATKFYRSLEVLTCFQAGLAPSEDIARYTMELLS